jgi:hypothetical protein
MTDPVASALSREHILLENALATVATQFVVLRDSDGHSRSILSLSRIRSISTVKLSRPGLLVLSAAAFLISAGAHNSKDGGAAALPIALVAVLLLIGFVGSRRAAVCFTSDEETFQTTFGTLSEASAVITAARAAINRIKEEPSSESLAS